MQLLSCYDEDVKLEDNNSSIIHDQGKEEDILVHEVIIDKNSKLYQIIGQEKIMVNSFHKRHATDNHIYKTVARSLDNQVEALEYPGETFNLGVQWHPEISYEFDLNSKKIIDAFILATKARERNKDINSSKVK